MFVRGMDHFSSHHDYSKQILLTPPLVETAQYLITAHVTGFKTVDSKNIGHKL